MNPTDADPAPTSRPIPELTLRGTPTERGRAHGEELRDLIDKSIDRWFEELAHRTEPRPFVDALVNETGFLAAAQRHTPGLVDEVRAIAEASGQTFATMFGWQLIDECWWYLDEITGAAKPSEACSAMALNDGTNGFVAQTQDLYRHFDGGQVFLRYEEPDGLEVLTPSTAGLLAYNGVNSAGLGVCITTLSELAHTSNGLSSGLVMPSLIRCRSIEETLAFLRETPLASGNSWTLGTRNRSVVVEASAAGVTMVDDGATAFHTNHALAQRAEWQYVRFEGSVERLEQLQASLGPDSTLEKITDMYRTGPICRPVAGQEPVISVATMIFELGDHQRCHFAPGPLDTVALATYDMS